MKYKLCGKCEYKSLHQSSLDMHTKLMHPSSWHLMKEDFLFHCALCPFKTHSKAAFEQHDVFHRNQAAADFQCPLSSYGVDDPGHLNRHLELHCTENVEDNNNNDHPVIILLSINK